MLVFTGFTASTQDVQFTLEKEISTSNGYVKLQWEGGEDSKYELQQASDMDFLSSRTIYSGPDKASFISGLPDGNYYFRVRVENGSWSSPLILKVKHQSIYLAFTLFGLGAVVFLMTVVVVVKGVRNTATDA